MTQESEEKVSEAAEELKKAAQNAEESEEKSSEVSENKEENDPTLQAQLQAAMDKVAENYELYVRAVAEMENTRRRCAEDVRKAQLFGIEKFAKNLLPVIDSFEKALESVKDADEAIKTGIETTAKQFLHALEVSGMQMIDPAGETFDPEVAQAIATVPADDAHPADTVVAVFQKGWKLNDRVIRAAMVSVAK